MGVTFVADKHQLFQVQSTKKVSDKRDHLSRCVVTNQCV